MEETEDNSNEQKKSTKLVRMYDLPPDKFTEARVALDFVECHRGQLAYVTDWNQWMGWDGKIWKLDESCAIERLALTFCMEFAAKLHSESKEAKQFKSNYPHDKAERFIQHIQSRKGMESVVLTARGHASIKSDRIDAKPMLVALRNGVFDFTTNELRAHRASDLLTEMLPYEYKPSAQAPRWKAFLNRIFANNEALILWLQRALGYSLTGATGEKCLFVLLGESGNNGKTTLLEVVRHLVNGYGMVLPMSSLLVKKQETIPADIARLKGKRFALAAESNVDARFDEATLKRLTGGDTITARRLYREYFEFTPTHKLWLACNHAPEILGVEDAIWKRIKLIPCNVHIPDHEIDPNLKQKLVEEEGEGILNWLIEGAELWAIDGFGGKDPVALVKSVEDYSTECDTVGNFLAEQCQSVPDVRIRLQDLYLSFSKWTKTNKLHCGDIRWFAGVLRSKGVEVVRGTDNKSFVLGYLALEAETVRW